MNFKSQYIQNFSQTYVTYAKFSGGKQLPNLQKYMH